MQRKRNLWISMFLVIAILLSTFVNAVPADVVAPFDNKELVEFDHDIGYYAYYYNINSAEGDMYWRVYNSNMSPEQKYVFVSYDENMYSLVESYAECVDNMIRYYGVLMSSAEVLLVKSVFSTVSIAVAVASGNTVSAIATTIRKVMNIASDVDDHIVKNMARVYHYADLANDYYSSIT